MYTVYSASVVLWLACMPRVQQIVGSRPWSCQTKDFKIGICCYPAKHTALMSNNKDWLAWNQEMC